MIRDPVVPVLAVQPGHRGDVIEHVGREVQLLQNTEPLIVWHIRCLVGEGAPSGVIVARTTRLSSEDMLR
jgi:hypothetical protein